MAGGFPWTTADDEHLRNGVAAGWEYQKIGHIISRSENACRLRASHLGLQMSAEAVTANRKAGRDRFWADKARVREWKRKIKKALRTPQSRAIFAEELRQRNLAGKMGVRHHSEDTKARISAAHIGRVMSPETRKKISEGRKAYWAAKRDGGQSALRQVMLADKRRRSNSDGDEQKHIWCGQCERQVSYACANACASPFCKAKALAA